MKIEYLDALGERKTTKWDRVFHAVGNIKTYVNALRSRFIERDEVMDKLMMALLLREHLLIWGVHGSAKTEVADAAIEGIQGATTWSKDLSRFTTDTMVFGDYDINEAQKTGRLTHMTEGSLVEAHFANLGELLDANEPLLRTLMRLLNRRQFIRGSQKERCPLMTVIANTNFDPRTAGDQNEPLRAVLDRFLFKVRVNYVREPGNRLKMLKNFLARESDRPLPELNIEDVEIASGVVLALNLVNDPRLHEAYELLGREFGEKRGITLSDRLWLKAAQAMEASALLNGHTTATIDDLDAAQLVLVTREEDAEAFTAAVTPIKKQWADESHQQQIVHEHEAIETLMADLSNEADLRGASIENLVKSRRTLVKVRKTLLGMAPSTASNKEQQRVALESLSSLIDLTQQLIDEPEK
jgi:MoxR-like ATPase